MTQSITAVTVLVRDYDEAIAYFTQMLAFDLVEDIQLSDTKRWVLVAPRGSHGTRLLLAKAEGPRQGQIGTRSAAAFSSSWRPTTSRATMPTCLVAEFASSKSRGTNPDGTVAVFEDLYGNRWDLVEPKR